MTGPLQPPAFLQAGTYTARHDRQYLVTGLMLKDSATPTRVKAGVLPDLETRRAPASQSGTGPWTVTIGPYRAVVPNTQSADAGDYLVSNLANDTVTVAAADPTQNRIDLIGVQVKDAQYSGALNEADLVVIQGANAAGTPSEPAVPANFTRLWRCNINGGVTVITFVDQRRSTNVAGAVYVPYSHELSDTGSVPGEMRLIPAAGGVDPVLQFWSGTAWTGATPKPIIDVFTGSGTWTKRAGLRYVRGYVVGGGGGGGGVASTGAGESSHAAGGGGGGYAEQIIDATALSASHTVTVGAGGAGVSAADGTAGGASSLGSHIVAQGGAGGSAGTAGTGSFVSNANAAGGTGTTGNLLIQGQASEPGQRIAATVARGGAGGGSHMGRGGGARGPSGNGNGGQVYGGGGGGAANGASQGARSGGNGAAGLVVVVSFF